jgi:origin recognition complex subunit 3
MIVPIAEELHIDALILWSFAENAEFVDDITTFRDLAEHLQSNGCHLAKLSAAELSVKHGVGGCFRSLLRQLLSDVPDVSDMAWL